MLTWKLEYKDGFHAIEQAVNAALDERLQQVGQDMATRARELAPVLTGYLRSMITFDVSDGRWIGGTLVAKAFYSGYVEYGTSRMAAQPFMNPAILQFRTLITRRGKLRLRGLPTWMGNAA